MNNCAPYTPARLFATSGAMLYVDVDGRLRQSDADTPPRNVFLAPAAGFSRGDRAVELLWREGGEERPIACFEQGGFVVRSGERAPETALQLVPLERGLLGLRRGEKYICAE